MKISKTGYKKNSKDKNEPALVIPSNKITMKDVDFPVFGISDTGDAKMMYPGLNYSFKGNYVYEFPVKKEGGHILPGRFKNPEGNWVSKYANGGDISVPDLSRPNWLDKYQDGREVSSKYDLMRVDQPTAVAASTNVVVPNIVKAPKITEEVKQEAQRVKKVMKETGAKSPAEAYQKEKQLAKMQQVAANQKSTLSVGPDKGVDYIEYPSVYPPENYSKIIQKPGVSGSTMTVFVDPKTGEEWIPPGTQAAQEEYSNLSRSNNVDLIGTAILAGSLGAPLVKAALPYLNAPAVLPYFGEVPWLTAGNVLGAGFASDAMVNRLPEIPGQISRGEYADAATNALMGGLDLYGAGMVSPLLKGAKSAAVEAGKYLTTQTALKDTYKINPWAFKPQEGMMYRGLGEEGFLDAIESGVFRPRQYGYAEGRSLAEKVNTPKQFGSTFYAPAEKFNVVENYGPSYLAEVPFEGNQFARRYGRKDWSWSTPKQISIQEGKILQKDWLRGYKEVDVPKQLPGSPNAETESDAIRRLLKAGNDREVSKVLNKKALPATSSEQPFSKTYPTLSKRDQLDLGLFTINKWSNPGLFWKMYNMREHGIDYDRLIPRFYDPTVHPPEFHPSVMKYEKPWTPEELEEIAAKKAAAQRIKSHLKTVPFEKRRFKKNGGWLDKYQDGGDYGKVPQSWKDKYEWTPNVEEEYQQFKNDPNAPSNLSGTDDINDYNTRGMWDSLDRPANWEQGLALYKDLNGEEWVPEEDGRYHGWSQHPGTGEWLKPRHHSTGWMNYIGYAFDPENTVVVNPEGFFGDDTLQAYPRKKKKDGGESQGKGYYDYIGGYSIFANGGTKSKENSWLNKYK